jgi:FkbM family methyltransferase
LLSVLRKPVDTFTPGLARLYRRLRDLGGQQSRLTPYGFTLAGDSRMASKDFEPLEVGTFLELLEAHDSVLDIGANIGFYSCLSATRGKHVIAFEPAARNLHFLYRNLWENHLRNIEVFPVGLGRRPGLERVYGFGGISSFVAGWAQSESTRSSVVPVATLDSIVAKRLTGKKLLIKMDVEGFELEVLAGALETLELSPRPTWIVEILLQDGVIPGGTNMRFAETFEAFWRCGYRCTHLNSTRSVIQPSDVHLWCAAGKAPSKNFLFAAP